MDAILIMTDIHYNSGTVSFQHNVNSRTIFGFHVMVEKSIHAVQLWRRSSPKRAWIVTFVSAHDLYELILKKNIPNERTPEIKGNRKYRLFAASEFHAWKELLRLKINPELVESVEMLNP
jgi:hypothetical protein